MSREKPVDGFDYLKGLPIARTPREWQQLFTTHSRRVENGETFFQNKTTKRTDYEAYANIPAV